MTVVMSKINGTWSIKLAILNLNLVLFRLQVLNFVAKSFIIWNPNPTKAISTTTRSQTQPTKTHNLKGPKKGQVTLPGPGAWTHKTGWKWTSLWLDWGWDSATEPPLSSLASSWTGFGLYLVPTFASLNETPISVMEFQQTPLMLNKWEQEKNKGKKKHSGLSSSLWWREEKCLQA